MFKKPFTVNVTNKVSGADRKKLRRALEKAFPGLQEDELDAVLPNKAGDMEVHKLKERRDLVYTLDTVPILLDSSGKGDLYPTVFGLWRAPGMLPHIYLKHPAVSQYIVGGADLMLPGVHIPPEGLPKFAKDALLCVCVHGNPMPIAVGVAGMSSEDAVKRKGGKLVEVMQVFGDFLWESMGGRGVPNDGFLLNAVVPVGTGLGGLDASDYQEDAEGQPLNVADDAAAAAAEAAEGDAAAGSLQGLQISGGEGADGGAGAAASSRGYPEDMDELLELVLLQALHKSVKDGDLPLNSGVLWNQHMLPVRPAGSTLDVKRSKHKKMSAFLKVYGKAGLLTLKEDKHSGDMIVTAIDRSHELYQEFRPMRASATEAGAAAAGGSAGGNSSAPGAAGAAGSNNSSSNDLVVEEVYKPGKEVKPVFEALGLPTDGVYSPQEIAEVAFAYVKAAKLEENAPDERTIVLDATLCDALFKGVIKKGELFPSHLAKAQLREAFTGRCSAQCRITRGGEQVLKKGAAPSVHISIEKRQGNKRVTRVVGLEPFLVDPAAVSSGMQRKFAGSCAVNELPGKGQGVEVVLQGERLEEVGQYLVQAWGIPKKYIELKAPKK